MDASGIAGEAGLVPQNVWHVEPGGVFARDTDLLHLEVMHVSGSVRFLVLRRSTRVEAGAPTLLGSGSHDTVQSAMEAADRMAARSSYRGQSEWASSCTTWASSHEQLASNGRA